MALLPILVLTSAAMILPSAATQANETPALEPDMHEGKQAMTASGRFDVALEPASDPDMPVARMTLDKTFEGDLTGTSRGQMLAVRTDVEGSAGYVAIERFEGSLGGRKGSFALQHSGMMDRGQPSLAIQVIPDSGTGDLAGIAGTMTIDQSGSDHRYVFDYTLP
ncbi:DUF3224 domain-containing protein [Novosphingopyxis sp.]|uniref:DUF3224 domain-containing protein n=1 Tax=Novosphingopyxis sp. TaxID=2709690 RepID=UPI003B5B99D7